MAAGVEQAVTSGSGSVQIEYRPTWQFYGSAPSREDLESALEMYESGLEIVEELEAEQKNPEIQRDLSISYERIGGIYERIGGFLSKRKFRKMYEKCLKIREELAESFGTIQSYDDLLVILYKAAVCPGTKSCIKKQYLEIFQVCSELIF